MASFTSEASWDIAGLVAFLGGDAHVSNMLRRYGYRPLNAASIQAWKNRKSIPADRLADLFALSIDMHTPADPGRYLITKTRKNTDERN